MKNLGPFLPSTVVLVSFILAVAQAPGDRQPLIAVHPSYTLLNIRPDSFRPQVGGMDFFSDGRLAVATYENLVGNDAPHTYNVYILSGVEGDDRGQITVRKFADNSLGFSRLLGIVIVNDEIYGVDDTKLFKFVDQNGDGTAERYEVIARGWTEGGRTFGLTHANGKFYFSLGVDLASGGRSETTQTRDRSGVIEVNMDGTWSIFAAGMRIPNGISPGPAGEVFVADNNGSYVPDCKLMHIRKDRFYGHPNSAMAAKWQNLEFTQPIAWLPQSQVGRSTTNPVFLPEGRYAGQVLLGDVTYGGIQRIFMEKTKGEYQGAVFRFCGGLEAGVQDLSYRKGGIYIGEIGMPYGNWHWRNKLYGLQRIKENGRNTFEMMAVRSLGSGEFAIDFSAPVNTAGVNPDRFRVEHWRVDNQSGYGCCKRDRSTLSVRSVTWSNDRKTAVLEIPGLREKWVVYFRLVDIRSGTGDGLWTTEAWYTLNAFGPGEAVTPVAVAPKGNRLTFDRHIGLRSTGSGLWQWEGASWTGLQLHSMDGRAIHPVSRRPFLWQDLRNGLYVMTGETSGVRQRALVKIAH